MSAKRTSENSPALSVLGFISQCSSSLKEWHGRPAREDTRKMRVPRQTASLPLFSIVGYAD
jgi:hypothetical protein